MALLHWCIDNGQCESPSTPEGATLPASTRWCGRSWSRRRDGAGTWSASSGGTTASLRQAASWSSTARSSAGWLYYILPRLQLNLLHSTMTLLGSTWLYHAHSTVALLGSTWLYYTLPWLYSIVTWLYLTLHDSTTFYHGSTSLYYTLRWLYLALLDSTTLYHC